MFACLFRLAWQLLLLWSMRAISSTNTLCRILQNASSPDDARWLPGARLNIAHCAISSRDQDALAVLWAEESAPSKIHTITLGQLRHTCMLVAAAVRKAGLLPGTALKCCLPQATQ